MKKDLKNDISNRVVLLPQINIVDYQLLTIVDSYLTILYVERCLSRISIFTIIRYKIWHKNIFREISFA